MDVGLTLRTTDTPEIHYMALDEFTGMENPSLGTIWP